MGVTLRAGVASVLDVLPLGIVPTTPPMPPRGPPLLGWLAGDGEAVGEFVEEAGKGDEAEGGSPPRIIPTTPPTPPPLLLVVGDGEVFGEPVEEVAGNDEDKSPPEPAMPPPLLVMVGNGEAVGDLVEEAAREGEEAGGASPPRTVATTPPTPPRKPPLLLSLVEDGDGVEEVGGEDEGVVDELFPEPTTPPRRPPLLPLLAGDGEAAADFVEEAGGEGEGVVDGLSPGPMTPPKKPPPFFVVVGVGVGVWDFAEETVDEGNSEALEELPPPPPLPVPLKRPPGLLLPDLYVGAEDGEGDGLPEVAVSGPATVTELFPTGLVVDLLGGAEDGRAWIDDALPEVVVGFPPPATLLIILFVGVGDGESWVDVTLLEGFLAAETEGALTMFEVPPFWLLLGVAEGLITLDFGLPPPAASPVRVPFRLLIERFEECEDPAVESKGATRAARLYTTITGECNSREMQK